MIERQFIFPVIGKVGMIFTSKPLADFVTRQLVNYSTTESIKDSNEDDGATIKIYNSDIVNCFQEYARENLYVSRNFVIGSKTIKLGNLEYIIKDDKIIICYRNDKSLIQIIKQIHRTIVGISNEAKYRNWSGFFYSRYLFPLFSIYAACYGYYCVHGSLLQYYDRYILLTGLDGVGKSTIANMIASEGGEILADNIVLYNGVVSLNFNLVMRVDVTTQTKYKTIHTQKTFKEILPDTVDKGQVKDLKIFNIIREKTENEVRIEPFHGQSDIWKMYLDTAPEIEEANRVMTPWSFIWNAKKKDNCAGISEVFNVYIPEGKIYEAKERICR